MEKFSECEICHKQFSTNSYKTRHISVVHGDVKIYACNVCNKNFGHKSNLISHNENNHKEKCHNCKTCGKLFPSYENLKNHIKTVHEILKNHKCDSCENSSLAQKL